MYPAVELSADLREEIVSYLGVWEIISLSETCHQALQDVEGFARRELDRIEREHDVDDTWRFRVGMQAAQDAAVRMWGENQNWRQRVVPNNISHRRMLRSAYSTHLYSLGTTPTFGYEALAMHPNGKCLLSRGHGPRNVRLWNLSTKECIKAFSGHQGPAVNVGFSAGRIVSSSSEHERMVSIWSMDGVRRHHVDIEGDITTSVNALAVSDDSVYTVDIYGPISVVHTISGTVTSMDRPWGETHSAPVELCVCKNLLLHMRGNENLGYDDEDEQRSEDNKGLYVFDRDSMEVQSRLVGNFCSIACTSDGDIAVSTSHGEIQVFQLQEDGNLVSRLSIPAVEARSLHSNPREKILHMTNSRIFVLDESLGKRRSRITVYNAMNGTLERRLVYPTADGAVKYYPSSMASNDREVFVGFRFGNEYFENEGRRAGCAIKAFLR